MLVGRTDDLDRTFLLAQLINGASDIDQHPHRDGLDARLAEPIGREAEAMSNLMNYLKG